MNHNSLYCNLYCNFTEVNSSEACIFVAYTGECEVLFLTLFFIQIKYQRTKAFKKINKLIIVSVAINNNKYAFPLTDGL